MGISPATFQSAGQIAQVYIPGAYSRIDTIAGSSGIVAVNNGVIMGRSLGGEPNTLLQFNNPTDAAVALKGGPLMEAIRLAFNPGNGYVPQRIFAMRVGSAVQSYLYFTDGSHNMIKLTAQDYGLLTNQLRATLAAGTSSGKKVTIEYQSTTETYDNIIRNSLTILHSSACTMTIVNNSTTHTLSISVGPVTVDLNTYSTMSALVSYLNTIANVTATCVSGQEDASTLLLDSVSAVDVHTSTYTAQSTMQAIIDTINAASALVEATDVSAANNRVIPNNASVAYFTGGSDGTYDSTAWTNALSALEAENVQFISTPDPSSSVIAAIKAHCASMNSIVGRKERQYIVGGTWGDSVATAVAEAGTINDFAGMYVYNGGTQYNSAGVIQNFDASYTACMLMGMACAVAINMPLTAKTVNYLTLEKKLKDSELETLIKGGVAPLNYNSNGVPEVIRQITAYQADMLQYNEFSVVKEMFFVSRDLRAYVESIYKGQPGNISLKSAAGIVDSRLSMYAELGVFTKGTEGYFWNVTLSLNGDQLLIDYDAYITCPINFMFITQHFHTVAITQAAA